MRAGDVGRYRVADSRASSMRARGNDRLWSGLARDIRAHASHHLRDQNARSPISAAPPRFFAVIGSIADIRQAPAAHTGVPRARRKVPPAVERYVCLAASNAACEPGDQPGRRGVGAIRVPRGRRQARRRDSPGCATHVRVPAGACPQRLRRAEAWQPSERPVGAASSALPKARANASPASTRETPVQAQVAGACRPSTRSCGLAPPLGMIIAAIVPDKMIPLLPLGGLSVCTLRRETCGGFYMSVQLSRSAGLAAFADCNTVVLTTFRRDGTPVDTAVQIAVESAGAFIRSPGRAWKSSAFGATPQRSSAEARSPISRLRLGYCGQVAQSNAPGPA